MPGLENTEFVASLTSSELNFTMEDQDRKAEEERLLSKPRALCQSQEKYEKANVHFAGLKKKLCKSVFLAKEVLCLFVLHIDRYSKALCYTLLIPG